MISILPWNSRFYSNLQNYAITDAVQKIASEYKCKPIEGMLSHQLKQFKIDGEKTIIQNPNEAQRKEHEKCEFALHEVYAIDVLISTGEGVGREKDTKVSIFKKTDENYQLKLKASRALITEVCEQLSHKPIEFIFILENNYNARYFRYETSTETCHSIYGILKRRQKHEWVSLNVYRIK